MRRELIMLNKEVHLAHVDLNTLSTTNVEPETGARTADSESLARNEIRSDFKTTGLTAAQKFSLVSETLCAVFRFLCKFNAVFVIRHVLLKSIIENDFENVGVESEYALKCA